MNQAKDYRMPFGKYKGKTLDEISQTDEGLLYLDWCRGEFKPGITRKEIEDFLSDDDIDRELDKAMEAEDSKWNR